MPKKIVRLGKKTVGTQLYLDDEKELHRRVSASGRTPAEIVREIVKNQFAADRLKAAGYDMTNSAVIKAQKSVVAPITKELDSTNNEMQEIVKRIDELTNTVNQRTAGIADRADNQSATIAAMFGELLKQETERQERDLERHAEQIKMMQQILGFVQQQLDLIVEMLRAQKSVDAHLLRQIITLRGLVYIYVLGYQSGALKISDLSANGYVRAVQGSANNLFAQSEAEIKLALEENFDGLSRKVANDLNQELQRVAKLSAPKTDPSA